MHLKAPSRLAVSLRRLMLSTAVLTGLLAVATPARAQRLPSDQFRSGQAVLRAFQDVVAKARHSTVELVVKGEVVAMGTIVDSDGWILSKASQLSDDLVCHLADGRELPATQHGTDRSYDLALLKVDAENLPAVEWDNGSDPLVGQWLATTGMGTLPLAVGVMSVQRRAVPRERGLLGISISDAENGAQVTKVHAESGADQAGLKEGDVITSVAGKIVDTGSALANTIRQFSPGDRLELLVMRGTKKLTIRATLSAPFGPLMSRGQVQNLMGGKLSTRRGGFPLAFQHDTVLAPEQCGGPVVNLDGRVVGINLARSGRVESYALPADIALKLIAELKSSSVEKLTATSSATPLPVAAE